MNRDTTNRTSGAGNGADAGGSSAGVAACSPRPSGSSLQSSLGTQIPLPFRRAFQIALQGLRIRLGRSLVTLSGVVLGIAFLMSTVTTQFIDRAVAKDRDARRQVDVMERVLQFRIGSVKGKTLAVARFGALSPMEEALLARVRAAGPEALRLYSDAPAGNGEGVPLAGFARGAAVVLLLGDSPRCPVSLAELTEGMTTRLVLDGRADRVCIPDAEVRRELFLGKQLDTERERQVRQAEADLFRTIWIVVISLAVTVIGVANALLMSVTERFREIGTMKCLGALSSFIRLLFLIESGLIGLTGSIVGAIVGTVATMTVYGFIWGFAATFGGVDHASLFLAGMCAVVVGTILSMLAALYPAWFASRMVPAAALRSTV
ncbi:MAG: FtsX-like permease family protein [bacterium]